MTPLPFLNSYEYEHYNFLINICVSVLNITIMFDD